jgi:hypothetical protein
MTPTLPTARAEGERLAGLALDRAERHVSDFSERARAFIVDYLRLTKVSSGELIVDACKLAGIKPPDDRAFGGVFGGLRKAGLIEADGYCLRRKGHGTGGGRVWRLK